MNTKLFISSIFLSTSLSLFTEKCHYHFYTQTRADKSFPKKIYGHLQSIWELLYLWWTLGG